MKIIVKIGTNAITNEDASLNMDLLTDLVRQFAKVREEHDILIVTSGAMGCGRSLIKVDRHDEVTRRQLYAVVGQVKLMEIYAKLFAEHDLKIAQMLTTQADFENRVHFLNTKHCVESLFKEKIIPVMNENDFVAIEELMFTDNDELSGIVSKMLIADKLIVLTNVDGVYDENGAVMPEFKHDSEIPSSIVTDDKSSFGKGGMQTKFKMAQDAAGNGTEVIVTNSKEKDVILRVLEGEKIGTRFLANNK
jgi:glutamate 5-kinase